MVSISLRSISKSYTPLAKVLHDISFEIREGEFLVIVGPSGCGKSTLLRMIAGLESITSGELFFDDKKMNDVLAKDRDVGMVFQNYALYPHLTVSENISFPLTLRKVEKAIVKKRVAEVSLMLQLEELLQRKPKELSGGQRQRVALGRAIARNPKCFLFDEPLSNLDAQLRNQMRSEILSLQKKVGATSIYVTHDQTEAMTMGDRIAVLNNGILQQVGTPKEVYHNPVNMFVAGFVGTPSINKIWGSVDNGRFISSGKEINISLKGFINEDAVICAFRPEDIIIDKDSALQAEIQSFEYIGHETLLYLRIGSESITARTTDTGTYSIGEKIGFKISPEKVLLFDKNENNVSRNGV